MLQLYGCKDDPEVATWVLCTEPHVTRNYNSEHGSRKACEYFEKCATQLGLCCLLTCMLQLVSTSACMHARRAMHPLLSCTRSGER